MRQSIIEKSEMLDEKRQYAYFVQFVNMNLRARFV